MISERTHLKPDMNFMRREAVVPIEVLSKAEGRSLKLRCLTKRNTLVYSKG